MSKNEKKKKTENEQKQTFQRRKKITKSINNKEKHRGKMSYLTSSTMSSFFFYDCYKVGNV